MRSLFVAFMIAVVGFAASCSGSAMVDLDQDNGKQISDTPLTTPDYIFWDGEGDPVLE